MSDVQVVQLGDVYGMLAVSAAHGYQLLMNARRVGDARRKFKVSPPAMDGPPELVRTMRVQVNDLEFGVPFEILFWVCGLTTHQGVACAIGVTYLYARRKYAIGYIEEAEQRWPGFNLNVKCVRALIYSAGAGLANEFSKQLFGVDLFGMAKEAVLGLVRGAETEL